MRLRTLGGLWIDGEDPPSLGPRTLALLAVVAASGRKGISRDRVVGILWPESSDVQARHTLSQTLYSLRRDTGRDLIAGSSLLRLDEGLTSDIAELRAAGAAGDLETVAALYAGRFLEGFYLPGAAEFERWVEEERARLQGEAVTAIEHLAMAAAEAGKHSESARWWQRLAELDPLSAAFAAGHMRALAAAGDRSGALARARRYRETVRRELDAEPDPSIQNLEQSLRTAAERPSDARVVERTVEPPEPPVPVQPARRAAIRRTGRWWPAGVVVLVATIAVVLLGRGTGSRPVSTLPFLAVGEIQAESPRDSSNPGFILRDMLATSLSGLGGLQVVANSRLVELMPRGPDPAPGAIRDAARRAGATELLEGELTGDASGAVLSLRRISVDQGVVRKGYILRAADRTALVDSATAAIARDLKLAPPSLTVVQVRTSSPAAYALYDEGLRAFYGYDAGAAYRLMKAALARDSSFAMAAYYVWQLSKFFQEDEAQKRVLPVLERLARNTVERERLLIQASLESENGTTEATSALTDTLTVKYPEDPDGQILLGTVRRGQGNWAGAVEAYQRAIALDSAAGALSGAYCRVCQALALTGIAYMWWDSLAAAERTSQRLIALRPDDSGPWLNLVEPLLRLGRRPEAEAALATTKENLGAWYRGSLIHRDLIRWGEYERVDRELIAEITHPNAEIRSDAWWLLLLSFRDQGRLQEADTLIHRWRVPNTRLQVPGAGKPAGDFALLGVELGRPEVSVRAHRNNLATMARWTPPGRRARNLSWQLVLAGTAYAASGDTAQVRRLADSLEALGPQSNWTGRDARLHYVLRGLLLQVEGRHVEAVEAFRRSLYSVADGYTRTNLMLARSLLALQRGVEAIPVLRSAIHGGVDGNNTYVSRTELHEALAQSFEQAGQPESAVVHWRAVELAWRHADPQFAERYQRARTHAGGSH